jgi:hypothetical protein
MSGQTVIPVSRFKDAFNRVGWLHQTSRSGRYELWTDPNDADLWTRLPSAESDPEYGLYQHKNLLMLLYALGLPEEASMEIEVASQLIQLQAR